MNHKNFMLNCIALCVLGVPPHTMCIIIFRSNSCCSESHPFHSAFICVAVAVLCSAVAVLCFYSYCSMVIFQCFHLVTAPPCFLASSSFCFVCPRFNAAVSSSCALFFFLSPFCYVTEMNFYEFVKSTKIIKKPKKYCKKSVALLRFNNKKINFYMFFKLFF